MTNKQEVLRKIEELKQELEKYEGELSKPDGKGWERVENDELYYFTNSSGEVSEDGDWNSITDDKRFESANYNTSKEYLEQIAFSQTLERKMIRYRDLNDVGEIDWKNDDQAKHYIYYSHNLGELLIDCYYRIDCNNVHFISLDVARNCLEEFKEDLLKKYTT